MPSRSASAITAPEDMVRYILELDTSEYYTSIISEVVGFAIEKKGHGVSLSGGYCQYFVAMASGVNSGEVTKLVADQYMKRANAEPLDIAENLLSGEYPRERDKTGLILR